MFIRQTSVPRVAKALAEALLSGADGNDYNQSPDLPLQTLQHLNTPTLQHLSTFPYLSCTR